MHCTGVILAGGHASRFGGAPKGLASVGGRRMLDRVADALRAATDDLLVVANAPGAAHWLPGVPVTGDLIADGGALGGIHAALAHLAGPALVVAWDMPFVTAPLLAELRRLGEEDRDADAAAPESGGPAGLEPLCAYYAPACLAPAERRLRSGDRRAAGLLAEVRTRPLPLARVRLHGDPALLFLNVNTPRALDDAARWAASA